MNENINYTMCLYLDIAFMPGIDPLSYFCNYDSMNIFWAYWLIDFPSQFNQIIPSSPKSTRLIARRWLSKVAYNMER